MYTIKRGWIDCAGKCRTWFLLDADGRRLAEVTTKRGAMALLALLCR